MLWHVTELRNATIFIALFSHLDKEMLEWTDQFVFLNFLYTHGFILSKNYCKISTWWTGLKLKKQI